MRLSKSLIVIILFSFLALLVNACGAQSQTLLLKPSPTTAVTSTSTPTPRLAIPVRLVIPRIGVNAPIENVGMTDDSDIGRSFMLGEGMLNVGVLGCFLARHAHFSSTERRPPRSPPSSGTRPSDKDILPA
ncbi:MAG: hypothetical protein ACXWOL_08960, partial [Ktedonobacteraceae bacterium]